jgi:hypothetical protein
VIVEIIGMGPVSTTSLEPGRGRGAGGGQDQGRGRGGQQ